MLRMVEQEEREINPHQEEIELVNLGTDEERKEFKVSTCMLANIQEELIVLLREYQDIFTWSYQDMPGLNPEILLHRLPLKPESSPHEKETKEDEA